MKSFNFFSEKFLIILITTFLIITLITTYLTSIPCLFPKNIPFSFLSPILSSTSISSSSSNSLLINTPFSTNSKAKQPNSIPNTNSILTRSSRSDLALIVYWAATKHRTQYEFLGPMSLSNKKAYAEATGYHLEYFPPHAFNDSQRSSHFAKLEFTLQLLERYEWVMWSDADMVIANSDFDMESLLYNAKDLIVSPVSKTINSGAYIARNSDWTKKFLRQVLSIHKYDAVQRQWHDQQAMIDVLNSKPKKEIEAHVTKVPYGTLQAGAEKYFKFGPEREAFLAHAWGCTCCFPTRICVQRLYQFISQVNGCGSTAPCCDADNRCGDACCFHGFQCQEPNVCVPHDFKDESTFSSWRSKHKKNKKPKQKRKDKNRMPQRSFGPSLPPGFERKKSPAPENLSNRDVEKYESNLDRYDTEIEQNNFISSSNSHDVIPFSVVSLVLVTITSLFTVVFLAYLLLYKKRINSRHRNST